MYKIFFSRANIFWETLDKVDKVNPEFDIDGYCNFIEIPKPYGGINYIDWLTGTAIVKDKDITYFKIERYTNDENNPELKEVLYFYVRSILRRLSNGYEVQLILDTWMTYTRHIFKTITTTNNNVLVNRMSLTNNMYGDTTKHLFRLALTNTDVLTDNLESINPNVNLYRQELNSNNSVYYYDGSNGGFYNFTFENRTQQNTKSIIPYGLCIVYLEKDTGNFLIFPYQSDNASLYSINVNGKKIEFDNSINLMDEFLIGETHTKMTFIGVFRNIPLAALSPDDSGFRAGFQWYVYTKQKSTGAKDTRHFLYLKMNPENGFKVKLPSKFNMLSVGNSFVKSATMLHNKLYWTNQVKRIKDYIMDDKIEIQPSFRVYFNNEFVLYPDNDKFLLTNRLLSFGGALPSATDEYARQQLASRTRYDSGIANGFLKIASGVAGALTGGIGSSINGALINSDLNYADKENEIYANSYLKNYGMDALINNYSNPPYHNSNDLFTFWNGATTSSSLYNIAGIGSIGSGISQLINESIRFNNQKQLNNATYFNSDTQTIYWSYSYINLLNNNFGSNSIFTAAAIGTSKLYRTLIELENDVFFQYQVNKTYNMYGFPLNCYVNINNCLTLAQNKINKLYVDFNQGWITENIRRLMSNTNHININNFNMDIINLVATELVGGIRVWYNNNFDYDNFDDYTEPNTKEVEVKVLN